MGNATPGSTRAVPCRFWIVDLAGQSRADTVGKCQFSSQPGIASEQCEYLRGSSSGLCGPLHASFIVEGSFGHRCAEDAAF